MANKHLLIVYHSQSGSTTRMAEAVVAGTTSSAVDHVDVRERVESFYCGPIAIHP
ncbi:MAG: hypothetical protein K0U72_09190 [Gammaproteobacteria bacterium]|nr:hypothetical protein [Gammaproteobacteria bacterium]